jgi:hypothetical protein
MLLLTDEWCVHNRLFKANFVFVKPNLAKLLSTSQRVIIEGYIFSDMVI